MKLLLIEDNLAMQTTLQRALARQGWQVALCADGARALARWHASLPDVVLLDLSLPGLDGLQVLSQARAQGLTTPVLVLTARSTVGDRVLGLNGGADDYLAKPFDLDELEARVRALARRAGLEATEGSALSHESRHGPGPALPTTHSAPASATFFGLRADRENKAVYFKGKALDLSARESSLLHALLVKPGQAVAKERLSELVFRGEGPVQTDAIEVVAYRLRKKLAPVPVQLVTLRGLGYLLQGLPEPAPPTGLEPVEEKT